MALSTIQLLPLRKLRTDAAASFKRAQAGGAPKKRLESGWRSETTQQKLYDLWKSGKGNFALPPSQSNHVKGIAIDVYDDLQAWMVKHGAYYGWTRDKNEPWHFDYDPAKDQALKALKAANSHAALVAKVKKVQAVLKVTRDGEPGPKTQAAWVDTMRRSKAGQFWYKRRFNAIRKVLGTKDTATTEKAWANLVRAVK
jgi:hypothetical protein